MTHRLILTRPKAQSLMFADLVSARFGDAFDIEVSPALRIEPIAAQIDAAGFSGFVFTSVNGVAQAGALGLSSDRVAYCVGPRTKAAALAYGFECIAGQGNSAELESIIARNPPEGRLLHLRGEHSRGDLAERLSQAGIACEECVVYRQVAQELTARAFDWLRGDRAVILALFSPRTAAIVTAIATPLAPVHVIALSKVVLAGVEWSDDVVTSVTERPTGDAMLDLLAALI